MSELFSLLQVIVKNLSSGTRVVLKSHYGYEVLSAPVDQIVTLHTICKKKKKKINSQWCMINSYYQFFMVKGGLDRRGICYAIRKQVATMGTNWLRWGAYLYFFRGWTHKGGGGRTCTGEKPPWTNTMSIQGQFYEFHNVACPDFPPSVQSPHNQNWWFW